MNTLAGGTQLNLLQPRDDVASRVIDGTFTLLSAEGRQVHLLNETAVAVWEAIGEGNTIEHVCAVLGRRFDVDPAVLRSDVERAIEGLEDVLIVGPDVLEPSHESQRDCRGTTVASGDHRWRVGPFRALDSWLTIAAEPSSWCAESQEALRQVRGVLDPLSRFATPLDLEIDQAVMIRVAGTPGHWTVWRGQDEVGSARSTKLLREVLLAEVNRALIDTLVGSVGFHAGAVEFPEGVVVFPGHSDAGKSTLVLQLVQRGHGYLTDELAALSLDDRRVMSFPKSVCVDPGAQSLFPELAPQAQRDWSTWHVDLERIASANLGAAGEPVAFVFPEFRRGESVTMRQLTPADALPVLLENSFDFAATGARGAALLLEIASVIPCYSLHHGGQPEHIAVLEELFGRRG